MSVDYYAEFCNKIIYNTLWLKKQYSLSNEKMAEIIGVEVTTINNLEKGCLADDFTVETLFEIGKAFNIDVKIFVDKYLE